jgi:hypothetical protein
MRVSRALMGTAIAAGAMLMLHSPVEGASIYLDLGSGQTPNVFNAPAPGHNYVWNTIVGHSGGFTNVANLVDQDGVATGVSYTTTDIWVFDNNSGPSSTEGTPAEEFQQAANDALYLTADNPVAVVVLGNLTADAYDFVFFGRNQNVASRNIEISAQGAGAAVNTGPYNTGNNNNYETVSLLGEITLTFTNNIGANVYLNTIKVTPVPEPAFVGAGAVGAIGLLARRRRHRVN